MANNASAQVISRLQRYFTEDNWLDKAKKKNPNFASTIENLSAEKIHFGKQPTFVRGYVSGNSTASGESTYGDTTTRRTISMDFTTDEKLFISYSNKADDTTCQAAADYVLKGFTNRDIYHQSDARSIAEKHGKNVCNRSLLDLNFFMKDYRLNRYDLHLTTNPFTVPIWPIYADITDENGKAYQKWIGYWYTKNNEDFIHLNIGVPMTGKNKMILFGAIAGAAIIAIAVLFMLFQ